MLGNPERDAFGLKMALDGGRNMRCPLGLDERGELVVGYTARTLDVRARSAFEKHLKSCRACTEALAEQQSLWDALDGWRVSPVSVDFDGVLRSRIALEGRLWWPWPARNAVVPVIAAGVVLSVVFWLNPRPATQVVTPSSAPPQIEKLEHALDDMDMLGQLIPK